MRYGLTVLGDHEGLAILYSIKADRQILAKLTNAHPGWALTHLAHVARGSTLVIQSNFCGDTLG